MLADCNQRRAADELYQRALYVHFRRVRDGARPLRHKHALDGVWANGDFAFNPTGRLGLYDLRFPALPLVREKYRLA